MSALPSDDDARGANRRIYGRGLFDGLRLAGVSDPEQFMNVAKLTRATDRLDACAQKVLAAVPLSEPWTKTKIHNELYRLGVHLPVHQIDGCLDRLRGIGLIREPTRGFFLRPPTPARDAPVLQLATTTEPAMQQPLPAPPQEADIAAEEAAHMKLERAVKTLQEVGDLFTSAMFDLSQAAAGIAAEVEKLNGDTAKLRQLQTLLKGF